MVWHCSLAEEVSAEKKGHTPPLEALRRVLR